MSQRRLRSPFALLVVTAAVLAAASALAQDDPPPTTTWRPSGGSLFGNTPPQSSGSEIGGRPQAGESGSSEGEGLELLVFDLTFTSEVSFEEGYVERFEAIYSEAIEGAQGVRPLRGSELRRRLRESSVLMGGELTADSAAQIADRIEADSWILPIIGAASGREYEIVVTRASLGDDPAARLQCRETSGRAVTAVESALRSALRQCLGE